MARSKQVGTLTSTVPTVAQMMAAIKKFLKNVCAFSEEAAKEITTNQGYKDLDELFLLNNKGVNNLCTIMSKSSTISTGAIAPGLMIPSLAQEQLELSIFALKHKKGMSCIAKLNHITWKYHRTRSASLTGYSFFARKFYCTYDQYFHFYIIPA
jgi:hypothetical protein